MKIEIMTKVRVYVNDDNHNLCSKDCHFLRQDLCCLFRYTIFDFKRCANCIELFKEVNNENTN